MYRYTTLLILMVIGLISCSDHKTKKNIDEMMDTVPEMIMRIQKSSRLYTTEYHIHKIITHDDIKKLSGSFMNKDFSIDLPFGKRKIAIPMDANVKAYVDLSQFSPKNIRRNGAKIEIILPDPKFVITSTKVNRNEVKQYIALLRSDFSDEELTSFERQGREAIIKELPQMDLIEKSRISASQTLIPFIAKMGFKQENVTVSFRKKFTIDDFSSLIDKSVVDYETPN